MRKEPILCLSLAVSCLFLACSHGDSIADPGPPSEECETNSDCADSEAARWLINKRCPRQEVYCWQSRCVGECSTRCEVVRVDENSCPSPSICGGKDEMQFCTWLPIECATAEDCPRVRPGEGEWTCEVGLCRFPGWESPTH